MGRARHAAHASHFLEVDVFAFVFLKDLAAAALARIALAAFVVGIACRGRGTGLLLRVGVGPAVREGAAREEAAAEEGLEEHVGKAQYQEYASEYDDE